MKYFVMMFLFAATSVFAGEPFQNVRLIWLEKPQTEAMIIWDSDELTNNDFVEVWKAKGKGKHVKFKSTGCKQYTDDPKLSKKSLDKKMKKIKNKKKKIEGATHFEFAGDDWFYRHVKVKGLKPGTKYKLIAHSNGKKSREFYFTTAPNDGKPFKLIYAGDSRTRMGAAGEVALKVKAFADTDPEVIGLVHGGDYADSPAVTYWKPWLAVWDKTTGKDGKLFPLIPIIGNHERPERSPFFGEAYGVVGDIDQYMFSCKLTDNCSILALNSMIPATGAQEAFALKTLEQYKKDKVTWQFVAFHTPVFPAIKKPSKMKHLIPAFEKYKVDLVLESDGHCIKRTMPIRDGKMHPEGVVYLGEGGFGAPQRTPKDKWYLKAPGFSSTGDHMMVLRVTQKEIQYTTVGLEGQIIDKKTFKARTR